MRPALIVGNGPSIKGFDFSCTSGFDVFGMNAAYRYWHKIGWYPDYYSCLDTVVGLSHIESIADLINNSDRYGIRAFLLRDNLVRALGETGAGTHVINFDDVRETIAEFSARPVTTGSHTLAWASSLGYQNAFIMGVDCDYVELIDQAEPISDGRLVLKGDPAQNPNYFFDEYQVEGDKYNIPNPTPDLHLISWRNVSETVPKNMVVRNINPQSQMDAFEFSTWETAHAFATKELNKDFLTYVTSKISARISRLFKGLSSFLRLS